MRHKHMVSAVLLVIFSFLQMTPSPAGAEEKNSGSGSGRIVITAGEIKAMNANTTGDVLNRVPGVKAGDTSVSIHGSSKVKVFVNGKPINDPTSNHGGVRWDMVTLEEIEKIEILRGKGGVEHGSDASGGVILITTRKIERIKGQIKTQAGKNDAFNTKINASVARGRLGMAVSGEYNTFGGYKPNNDKKTGRMGARLEYSPEENRDFILSADYTHDERGLTGLPEFPTPHSRKETEISLFSFLATIDKFKGKTYLNQGKKHNTDKSRHLDKTIKVKKFGQDFSWSHALDSLNGLNMGAGYEWGEATGTSFSTREESSWSAFSSWEKGFKSVPVTLTLGVRGVYHSEFDRAVNPEIKLEYKKKDWQVSASWSRANNTPSFYQRYNETATTIANPDLGMETADNFELGLSISLTPALSTHLSLFYNRLEDRITYVRDNNGIGQYMNIGQVTYKGGDAGMNWAVTDTVNITSAYTCLLAENEKTGLRLTAKPEHKFNCYINFKPMDKLSLDLNLFYTAKVYTNTKNTKTVPEYLRADVRAEFFFDSFDRFSIFSKIENIADKKYYYSDGMLAPGLNWLAGIHYHF
ncbi:MAG: TonB-dependent receptor [Desulfobacteraceae bacterium]|nr:TonB-dependent receptor [Desulfobacteraceae bacterium]